MFKEGDVVRFIGSMDNPYQPKNIESLGEIIRITKSTPTHLVEWRDCEAMNRDGSKRAWYYPEELELSTGIKQITTSFI